MAFAAFPLAASLAATALAASLAFGLQQQDDILPPQSAVPGAAQSGSAVLTFQDPTFLVTPWVPDTDLPPIVLDDPYLWQAPWPLTPPISYLASDDEILPSAHVVLEEEGWRGLILPWCVVPRALTDDEMLPGAYVVAEDESWQPWAPLSTP